jgi:hypothetical protein
MWLNHHSAGVGIAKNQPFSRRLERKRSELSEPPHQPPRLCCGEPAGGGVRIDQLARIGEWFKWW